MRTAITELREVIQKLVPLLTGKGLKVTQIGSQAYVRTNPNTNKPEVVNIPSVGENASDSFISAIQGFIDHEVAHVLITDWNFYGGVGGVSPSDLQKPAFQKLLNIHNIIEDTMIEREIVRIFPGSKRNIANLRRHFIDRVTKVALLDAKSEEEEFSYLIVPAMRALAGHPEFQDFMDEGNHWKNPLIDRLVSAFNQKTLDDLRTCSTTEETLVISQEMYKILYPNEESPPPGCSSDKSEQKDKDDEGKEDKEDESGENSDDTKDEDSEDSNPNDGDDEGSRSGDGAGRKSNDGEDGSDEGDDDENPDQSSGNGDDSEKSGGESGNKECEGDNDDASSESSGDDDDQGADASNSSGDGAGGGMDGDASSESGEGGGNASGQQQSNSELEDGDSLPSNVRSDGAIDEDGRDVAPGGGSDEDSQSGGGVGQSAGNKSIFDYDEDIFEGRGIAEEMMVLISDEARDAIDASDWSVFSREWDIIEPVKPPDNINEKWIPEMEDEVRHMTGRMQKDIERIMASQSHVVNTPGHKSGRLHSPSLWRISQGDPRVFTQKQEHRSKDTAVTLLVDNSGSMSGEKMRIAMMAAYALCTTLDRVSISHEMIGFTTGGWYDLGGSMRDAMEREYNQSPNRSIDWNRAVPIVMPIYKTFDERLNSVVKKRIAYSMNAQVGLGANIDGESLQIAAERISRRTEKRKVIIVLSDGQPAGGRNCGSHLKGVVGHLERNGIECVGIGIKTDAVQKFYPNNVVLNNVSDLPGQVMAEIKKILL